MAQTFKLTDSQQEIIRNLKQGCVGHFWVKTSDWGYYTHAELRSHRKTLQVKFQSVQALARKGVVKLLIDDVSNHGCFVLMEGGA